MRSIFIVATEGAVLIQSSEMPKSVSRGKRVKGGPPEEFPNFRRKLGSPEVLPLEPERFECWPSN